MVPASTGLSTRTPPLGRARMSGEGEADASYVCAVGGPHSGGVVIDRQRIASVGRRVTGDQAGREMASRFIKD